ncbi:MAG TPA: single-stranded DNA-binding protein [Bacillota bacterium]|jgi:single-stranded DNA-binding protein|nr:single-stranded DNA-binding protein [Bacillota bacterium]HQC48121.1 single-stranded DNA-binding protein [Bacillota bacterium]
MSIAAAFGNLANDPHISKNEQGEITFAKFTLVEDVYTARGKSVTYIDCVAFGRTAKIVDRLLEKGTEVYIEGSFVSGQYKGEEGKTVYSRSLRVNRLRLSSSRRASSQPTESSTLAEPEREREFETLPFLDEDELEYTYFGD